MEQLKTIHDEIELYNAGLPNFPRNFTRDSIISGILMKDTDLLKNQLIFSAKKQGKKKDFFSGEEAGKIFHEFPGYIINGLSTEFNACDTTALFLIGHYHYEKISKDSSLKESQRENIINAVNYIKSHLKDNIFYEDPCHSNSEKFALKVTYWKDSEMIKREKGMPVYPIAYFLAHAINLSGIRSASVLLDSVELRELAERMKEKLHSFYDNQRKTFYIAIDSHGPIEGTNSDMLHSLFYLEPGDLTIEEIILIEELASELETPIGYLTLSPKLRDKVKDDYHSKTIWPFEQAVINIGAKKFSLAKPQKVSRRIQHCLDSAPEIFLISEQGIKKSGCDPQLWTFAAKKYFNSIK